MSITRKYSKAKASGNGVVWTGNEPSLVPVFTAALVDGRTFGTLRVVGRGMFCRGFRAAFNTPSGDSSVQCSITLCTGGSVPYPGGVLRLDGVVAGADLRIRPPVPMPVNSIWRFLVNISTPTGDTTYYPQNLTVTYQLYYALGPVQSQLFTTTDSQLGVGFDQIDTDLIVY